MDYQTLKLHVEGHALVVRLHRPARRNAINFRMMEEIAAAAAGAETDGRIRAIVITGDEKCFSAGGDMHETLALDTPESVARAVRNWQQMTAALETSSRPVIAAIEGHCLTGGCELALACDIRIAGVGATFGITSAKIGTVPGAGATQRLPRIVGLASALELLFSAAPIDAETAFRIGLVNALTPEGGALTRALVLGELYATRAPVSLALIKQAVRQGLDTDLRSGLGLEQALTIIAHMTSDKREGISAFLEKREPGFVGK